MQLQPQVVATPAALTGTMVGGAQTLVSFALANLGGVASGNLQVVLPGGAPWLSVVTAQPMPSLGPGQTNQVILALTPTNNLTLGDYSGSMHHRGGQLPSARPVHLRLRVHAAGRVGGDGPG